VSHLSAEQFVDLLDGTAAPERTSAHLADCAACRARLADLRAVRDIAAADRTVEPSPLFWEHFSARVRTAVDSTSESSSPRRPAVSWTLGAAAAAAALLLIAWLIPSETQNRIAPAGSSPLGSPANIAAADVTMEPAADESWQFITELTTEMDWDAADEAGIVSPGTSERALLQLSDAERDELKRLLAAELSRGGPSL
jgi:hypothetical protein